MNNPVRKKDRPYIFPIILRLQQLLLLNIFHYNYFCNLQVMQLSNKSSFTYYAIIFFLSLINPYNHVSPLNVRPVRDLKLRSLTQILFLFLKILTTLCTATLQSIQRFYIILLYIYTDLSLM